MSHQGESSRSEQPASQDNLGRMRHLRKLVKLAQRTHEAGRGQSQQQEKEREAKTEEAARTERKGEREGRERQTEARENKQRPHYGQESGTAARRGYPPSMQHALRDQPTHRILTHAEGTKSGVAVAPLHGQRQMQRPNGKSGWYRLTIPRHGYTENARHYLNTHESPTSKAMRTSPMRLMLCSYAVIAH